MAEREGREEAPGLLDVLVPEEVEAVQAGRPALRLGRPVAEERGMRRQRGSLCACVGVCMCVCVSEDSYQTCIK